jgi:TonB family protein
LRAAARGEKHAVYPAALKKQGTMGEAKILLRIDGTGAITEGSVKSATHDEFGAAALEAVKAWRFKPAEENGQPVATAVTIPLRFTLTPKELFNAEVGREVFIDETTLTEKIYPWAELRKWINFRQKNAHRVPLMKHIANIRFDLPTFEGKRVYARQRVKLICSEDPNFGVKPATS